MENYPDSIPTPEISTFSRIRQIFAKWNFFNFPMKILELYLKHWFNDNLPPRIIYQRIIYHLNLVARKIIYQNYLNIENLLKYCIMRPDFPGDWIKFRLYRKGLFWLAHLEFIANWFAQLIGITSVWNASEFIEPYKCEVSWTPGHIWLDFLLLGYIFDICWGCGGRTPRI